MLTAEEVQDLRAMAENLESAAGRMWSYHESPDNDTAKWWQERSRRVQKMLAEVQTAEDAKRSSWSTEWDRLAARVLQTAKAHGWTSEQHDAISIALMHSELSEALEAVRHDNPPSEHIPEFSGVEEEVADVVIRVMDFGAARNLNIAGAVLAKMDFNDARPHKHGGKKF
jgi:NTP pyrophosphatase (non-canonical NTP hydrolase)